MAFMKSPCLLLLLASTLPMAVRAHHAVGAFFDTSVPMTIDGIVTSMQWQNPHVLLTIESDSDGAGAQQWHVESGGPTLLRRLGVTAEIAAVGDRVSISGYPSRVDPREMIGVRIELADGRSLPMFPTLAARFGIQPQFGVHITEEAAEAGSRSASGIFRVWTYGRTSDRPVVEPAYTPQALAEQAQYDPLVDDPALRCIAAGMPLVMDNPFPIEFSDRGEEVLLELELWDIQRTIHMTDSANGEGHRGTPLGFSTGRWEGNTLEVTTTDIDWAIFDDAGTPQGRQVRSVERFTLSDDEQRLDYEVLITDPETLLEPLVLRWHWDWVPGEALQGYGCTLVE
ncbi:MAG: DUF6152 family protein [Rhodospirillaceae bacterium]|nr:DUF6152 family protein [Rhodospirillaceae bacterium]